MEEEMRESIITSIHVEMLQFQCFYITMKKSNIVFHIFDLNFMMQLNWRPIFIFL